MKDKCEKKTFVQYSHFMKRHVVKIVLLVVSTMFFLMGVLPFFSIRNTHCFFVPFLCFGVGTILAFLLGCLLCVSLYATLHKKSFLLIFFLVLVSLGSFIYFYDSGFHPKTVSDMFVLSMCSLNSVISTFFPSRGDFALDRGILYHSFHLLVHFYFGVLLIAFLGQRFINTTYYAFIARNKDKIVFWIDGILSVETLTFANEYLQKKMNEDGHCYWIQINIVNDKSNDDMSAVMEYALQLVAGREIILNPNINKDDYASWCLNAPYHFFVSDDFHWNLKLAKSLMRKYSDYTDIAGSQDELVPNLYIRTDADIDVLSKDIESTPGAKKFDVHLINEFSIAAQQFIEEHPMLATLGTTYELSESDGLKAKGKIHMLLLGYGNFGKEILKTSVCNAQIPGVELSIDIVDSDPLSYEYFCASCADAVQRYCLNFVEMDVRSEKFYHWMNKGIPSRNLLPLESYNRIIICMGDKNDVNMKTAYELQRLARLKSFHGLSRIMFVYGSSDDIGNPESDNGKWGVFGERNTVFKYLLNNQLEFNAKQLNFFWSKGYYDNLDEAWRQQNYFSKQSSRASAIGQNTVLRLLYSTVDENADIADLNDRLDGTEYYNRIESSLHFLAEMEHLRWCAFHLMRGIVPMNIQQNMECVKANQIESLNSHAALVPFQQLKKIDDLLLKRWCLRGESPHRYPYLQLNDIDFILAIPVLRSKDKEKAVWQYLLNVLRVNAQYKLFFGDLLDVYVERIMERVNHACDD